MLWCGGYTFTKVPDGWKNNPYSHHRDLWNGSTRQIQKKTGQNIHQNTAYNFLRSSNIHLVVIAYDIYLLLVDWHLDPGLARKTMWDNSWAWGQPVASGSGENGTKTSSPSFHAVQTPPSEIFQSGRLFTLRVSLIGQDPAVAASYIINFILFEI